MSANALAEIAGLLGDPARANIVSALMAGRALTAGELAWHAGVSAQTTSAHLAKLTMAGLLAGEKQGRHRYYRLSSQAVAHAVEGLMALAGASPARPLRTGPRDEAMRNARTCYDHLAGRLGTALADRLSERGHVVIGEDGDGVAAVTEAGTRFLRAELGIVLASAGKRPLCRTCLDWSERRPHLAGRLGAAMLARFRDTGWIATSRHSRTVTVTTAGARGFSDAFGIVLPVPPPAGSVLNIC